MKIRSTILTLAALATLSVSALATTQASAWEGGYRGGYRDGYGGGYRYSGRHFGGYESSVATQFDVLAEIASACPSTSWVATIPL